jgi:site-specific DNA-methyltransferase (adenine-specific)
MEQNKIYHIDCLDGFKQLENKSVNHVFTSPPYNRKRNDKYEHHNDCIDDYFGWLCNVIDECIRVSKGYVFFNIMKNYYNKQDVFKLIGKYSENIVEIIVWEKTNPLPANGNNITNAYEFFLIFGSDALKSNTTYTKNIISTAVNSDMTTDHKAIMKQDVAEWFIKNFTKENDLILDCFMGAGTTAITCKFNKRNYIGFELNEKYVELSNKRIYDALGLFA